MLTFVFPEPKHLDEYREIIGEEAYEEIIALARPLSGKRVLHLNATPAGGGVAELLKTIVPLTNSTGLTADWALIRGAPEFFEVSKTMHNSLQGKRVSWTQEMWDIWKQYNEATAEDLVAAEYDFVVVHDPQPAAVLSLVKKKNPRPNGLWLWRCHIDLTDAQEEVWNTLLPYLEMYDAAIFTLREFARQGLQSPQIFEVPPGIDPLSPKNVPLDAETIAGVLASAGIDPARPLMAQISRFDPWKDPLGVIDAYREVKSHVGDIQLAMVAAMAADDPEGWVYYERTLRHAGEDPDIHFLTDPLGAGNDIPVNAIQTAADVVVQKSSREGFGLTVTEALWKARPVVAGRAGGIRLQVKDGETGYLVTDTQQCADRVLYLLDHPDEARRMGEAGKEHVRRHYLITRHLRDYLRIFNQLSNGL